MKPMSILARTSIVVLIPIIFTSSLFFGCSAVPKAEMMTAQNFTVPKKHDASVQIRVSGGGKPGTFLISNEEFKKAVETSILQSQVFSAILETDGAQYQLDIFIGDIRETYIGMNLETDIEAVWNLSRADTHETVWQKTIKSNYTAIGNESSSRAKRFNISHEKAAKANIEKGIELLSQDNLSL